jgi:hypothetical protein
MKLSEATANLIQILDEERRYPSVEYVPIPAPNDDLPGLELRQRLAAADAKSALVENRSENPRTILKGEQLYQFHSQNYNLLVTLFGRVEEADRTAFLEALAGRLKLFPAVVHNAAASFPSYGPQTSELPLVVEFLIRNGGRRLFVKTLAMCQPSPGIAIMLRQLEDIIALSYQIFSESEYESFSVAVANLRSTAFRVYNHIRIGQIAETKHWKAHGQNGATISWKICELCDSLTELCRKAGFLHLENALTENVNLEVNQDKYVVASFLEKFGFSGPLLTALNEAEKLNAAGATESELKSSMGHLRSFLENLHSEAIPQIQQKARTHPPTDDKWGTGLTYLRANGFLSKQEEGFVAGVYTLISDEAVHPLIAKREYSRLSRNVVIEYALLFLRKLEQLGAGP